MSVAQTFGVLALLSIVVASPIQSRSSKSQSIQWVDCLDNIPAPIQEANVTLPSPLPDTLKCGYLTVPLDYSKPICESNSLNISFAANFVDSSNGLLFYNPGGPGEEARSYAWALAGLSIEQISHVDGLQDFDFVAIDTRGTWSSNAFNCSAANFTLPINTPLSESEYSLLGENIESYIKDCASTTSPQGLYDHVGSDAVAQDYESVRAALGYDKLNYLGYSYGTIYGQEYLKRFPNNVGRFILDGVASFSQSNLDFLTGQSNDFNRLLERAEAYCQYNSTACPLASLGNGSVTATWEQVIKQYSDPAASNGTVSSGDIAALTSVGLFSGTPRFLSFIGAIALAATGNVTAFQYEGTEFAAAFTDSSLAVSSPTLCADFQIDDASYEGYKSLIENAKSGDKYGASYGIFDTLAAVCAFWPSTAAADLKSRYNTVTDKEYLIVSSDYDLNTPAEFSDIVMTYSPHATHIARHGDDHGSFYVPGPVRDAMLDYLYNGTIPKPTQQDIYSVYGPGQNKSVIANPYIAPIGAVAGDITE
ncbi:uncharacterized protein IL334_006924 [Kwoniella shivajii]|uniref:AB hydrolase-1 domain-containing protein n=1 Tax=Kwoniella shivajii TaxID=564305 RepID=A0ABZ1D7S1_9TREE|nr:hypothetical protein IL334_006924 [Kwoniella shivajii]